MQPGLLKIVIRSLSYYRKQVLSQFLIVTLLAAVITGSLLTGSSVRSSLKKSAAAKLGNTGILVSSGLRYLSPALPEKLAVEGNLSCSGFLEINGSCMNLATQKEAYDVNIYTVTDDFFRFHGIDSVSTEPGRVLVNHKLAGVLGIRPGDDVAIRFGNISDIPSDAPFAPDEEPVSLVLSAGKIPGENEAGDFSLSISQVIPLNAFIRISDLEKSTGRKMKFNRIIFNGGTVEESEALLTRVLAPEDIGLKIRNAASGVREIISGRVFIDRQMLDHITSVLPSGSPAITYMANSIRTKKYSTPYSFVSAVPENIYPVPVEANDVVISRWLAEDLHATTGDSVEMTWYSPDSLNHLIEQEGVFLVKKIVEMEGIWADQTLMPDFPGIAGTESCSDWNAGIPIDTKAVREKDEEYWRTYRGTPKAYIGYNAGKTLWGSNYGPATSVRFPSNVSDEDIRIALAGSIKPETAGIIVTDIRNEAIKAANESVDFSTLFLSLGFFLILASVILLSFAVSYYISLREKDIRTLYSTGFRNSMIRKILLSETLASSLGGCLAGALAGYLVSALIIRALNSVWSGAVQTDTLASFFDAGPVIAGFASTFILTAVMMLIFVGRNLKRLNRKKADLRKAGKNRLNILFIVILSLILAAFFILSLSGRNQALYSFCTGGMLLFLMIMLWRQFSIRRVRDPKESFHLSRLYYSFNPSHAVMPVLFISAGIFAFIITSVNRKDFNERDLSRSSGTGGYLLWCESTIPVTEDMNSATGLKNLGLLEDSLANMHVVQMKRSPGNDASCLNLNHITAPPLLGVDPETFLRSRSFSFAGTLEKNSPVSPWQLLGARQDNVIYGIADQTVLDWGLKIGIGDTLVMRAETGQPVSIIIAAGLQSSVFQGYVLIGKENLMKYFPSVSGNQVFLVSGNPSFTGTYSRILSERLAGYGFTTEKTSDRLRSFYRVTNTYLSVFGVFGGFGMITGIAGLGFVLLRNYGRRRKEFATMLATGFSFRMIRRTILREQVLIITAGVIAGVLPALMATLPSLKTNQDVPWIFLLLMIVLIFISGFLATGISMKAVTEQSLVTALKKE